MDQPVSRTADIRDALTLAMRQLTDARLIRLLLMALLVTLLITGPFLAVFLAIAAILQWVLPSSLDLPVVGQVGFLGVFTTGLVSKTSWIFWTYVMSPVVVAIIGIFLERIVDAVEAVHYPDLAPVRHQSFAQALGYGLRFLALMLGVSLAALIVSFFSGFFAPLVFIAANGYLIGREYFEVVALRRNGRQQAQILTRDNIVHLFGLGCLLAVFLAVPLVNLLVPIVGVAAYTHLYHRLA